MFLSLWFRAEFPSVHDGVSPRPVAPCVFGADARAFSYRFAQFRGAQT